MTRKTDEMVAAWFVLTPSGEDGPYFLQSAARDAAKPSGWEVVRRQVPFEESSVMTRLIVGRWW